MTLTRQDDHVAQALELLLQQFKDKPALSAWIASYVTQLQEIEGVLFDLLTKRALDTAEGAQLDGIGRIVGRIRDGLPDDEYRERLRVQILINLTSGTIEQTLTIIGRLARSSYFTEYGDDQRLIMIEGDHAEFTIELTQQTTADQIARVLARIKPGGVRAYLVWQDPTDDPAFSFGPNPDANGDSAGFDVGAFINASEG